jgi:hypothetical protein
MVRHDRIGMYSPAEAVGGLTQRGNERLPRAIRGKHGLAEVAAVDDMIPGSRKLEAKASRHTPGTQSLFSSHRNSRTYPKLR